jgi:hypothetical protein
VTAAYEAGFIAESVDDDQIRVVASDSGGVEIGACANRSGGAWDTSCWKDSVAPLLRLASLPREEFAPGSGNDLICRLGEGTFGQRSRLVTYSANASAGVGPAKGEVKITSATYQLVYEWSQSINVYAVPGLLKEHEPVVSSADYGVALRLIMDVSISSADSSLGATLGIAQLAAALQTDRAQINVRYSVLGAVKSFLPDGAIRIDSSADLFQVLADFHAQARAFASE